MSTLPSQRSFDVLVVGRGAIGASAALGLAQSGLRVGLVGPTADAPPAVAPQQWDARVYALSPATRSLLQSLRVWDALPESRIAPIYDMRVYAGPGVDAPELHLDAYAGHVDALAWIVEHGTLQQALNDALRYAGVAVVDDRAFGLTADPAGGSGRARLALGSGHSLAARLVVAADGAHSTVRELANISSEIRDYPQQAVVANFDTARPHGDTAFQWFGPHGVLALLPLPATSETSGRCSMVWSAPPELAIELCELSDERLAERVAEASQGALGQLTTITSARSFPLQLLKVDRMIAPRVVLIGDAAHTMHPLAGQGLNVGFGDVRQILQVLREREPYRDLADPLLWRRYERARREAVLVMQTATDGLQRVFGPLPEPLARLRDIGWRAASRSGWFKRRMIAHAVR